ncbi:MAG TPA: hypothetical protein VIT64_11125, partial [Ilumatobacteraceae bacterium]
MRRPPLSSLRSPGARCATVFAVVCLSVVACGDDSPAGAPASLTLLAYDSFVAPPALTAFTAKTGIEVEVAKGG